METAGRSEVSEASTSGSPHSVIAVYGGDADLAGSTSSPLTQAVGTTQVVGTAQTATALSSSANPSVSGQSVTYTATIYPGPEGGTVAFSDDANPIGSCSGQTVASSTGEATCTLTYAGTSGSPHSGTAVYGGDADFAGSTYSPLAQAVDEAPTAMALSSSANPSLSGQPVTYTATVSVDSPGAGSPSGSVTFTDNGQPFPCCALGVVSLVSVSARCTVTYAAAGPT